MGEMLPFVRHAGVARPLPLALLTVPHGSLGPVRLRVVDDQHSTRDVLVTVRADGDGAATLDALVHWGFPLVKPPPLTVRA